MKKGDHAIDCLRYLLAACGFQLLETDPEYERPPAREESADEELPDIPELLDEDFGEDYL